LFVPSPVHWKPTGQSMLLVQLVTSWPTPVDGIPFASTFRPQEPRVRPAAWRHWLPALQSLSLEHSPELGAAGAFAGIVGGWYAPVPGCH
jgi:hypothetical protein